MAFVRFAKLVSHLAGLFRWLFNLSVPQSRGSRSVVVVFVCFLFADSLSLRTNVWVALTWQLERAGLRANKALHPTAYSPAFVPHSGLSAAGELGRWPASAALSLSQRF